MQAIKDKLSDMNEMRKAKAEAKEFEKEEKEIAKARVEVIHEVRLAREAEAEMDRHVAKAAQMASDLERKHQHNHEENIGGEESYSPHHSDGTNDSLDLSFAGADGAIHGGRESRDLGSTTTSSTSGTAFAGDITNAGAPPTNFM